MSGRLLISLTLALCGIFVGVALWKRSTGTAKVREFWGARQAHLIQHAQQVEATFPGDDSAEPAWRDVSHAPGLIHLRATLVDDRYCQWPAAALNSTDSKVVWLFRFSHAGESIELSIDTDSGTVGNLQTQQSVHLIEASRKAVQAYLVELDTWTHQTR